MKHKECDDLTKLYNDAKKRGVVVATYPLPDNMVIGFDMEITDEIKLHFNSDYKGGFDVKLRIDSPAINDLRINISTGLTKQDVMNTISIIEALKNAPKELEKTA